MLSSSKIPTIHIAITLLATAAGAFDMRNMLSIADSNIETGSSSSTNATQFFDNDNDADAPRSYLESNELPMRFDDMQLWRIYNISTRMRNTLPVPEILEQKFGGIVWKDNANYLDISIGKEHLKAAHSFLNENELSSEILNSNIQELIDQEQFLGAAATQSLPGSRTKKASRSGIHWKDYHKLNIIYSFMREIRAKFPNICRLYTIGKTAEGRDLKVLRISENPREYKKIWIDGGIHAREWISPATVTYILYQLMSNWQDQPKYMKEKTWYFMPVMNPDGYVYSHEVNRLWRKNRAPAPNQSQCVGVDLNRNFDIGWRGPGSSTNPCSDIYRGASPASELETQAVVKFLTNRKFKMEAYLTYHSYGEKIAYPYAYKPAKVKNAQQLQKVGNIAVQRIQRKTGAQYAAGVTHEVLSIAGGGSDDWASVLLDIPYVYTVELRDKGKFGFVLPPNQILVTAQEGYIVLDAVAEAIN